MMCADYHLRLAGFLLFIILAIGCSGGGVAPDNPAIDTLEPVAEREAGSERMLWGMWDIHFDLAEMEVSAIQQRIANPHFDITEMVIPPACDDCLEIEVNSFDPVTRILDVDVTLSNPFPISGRDVRGIFMINDLGHELRNPDDWTKLWDIPGGQTLNPFKAFAKSETNRQFAGGTEHTENYLVYIPQPPLYAAIKFAVDASWPSNCKEPYSIENFVVLDDIYNVLGTSCIVEVDVHDWQDDVTGVTLVLPEITGESFTAFSHIGGTLWRLELINNGVAAAGEYVGRIIASSPNAQDLALYDFVTVTVTIGTQPVVTSLDPDSAQAGADLSGVILTGSDFQGPDATILLRKTSEIDITGTNVVVVDENTITFDMSIHPLNGLGLYDIRMTDDTGLVGLGSDVFEVLEPIPENPVDITPPWLNFSPMRVTVEGDYMYVAGGVNGLHIFWVITPSYPVWLAKVDSGHRGFDVAVDGNYAYVADGEGGLQIIDVTIPSVPLLVNTVDTPVDAYGIDAAGGYAYVCDGEDLLIIDVDPPESASIVKSVDMGNYCDDVVFYNGYACVTVSWSSVKIVDVDPPLDAYVVKTVETPGETADIDVADGYAYICEYSDGFHIIDINSPESASVIKTVPTNGAYSVSVSGDYAFVSDSEDGLLVIDINPPGDASVKQTLDCNPTNEAPYLDYSDGYVYMVDSYVGILVVDADPPETPGVIATVETVGGAQDVYFDNGLAYVANGQGGFAIVDVHPVDGAHVLSSVRTGAAQEVYATGGYAYLSDWGDGLHIIDVDPPQTPSIIHTVVMAGGAIGVDVSGLFAYTTSFDSNFDVIDIDPPGTAYVKMKVPTSGVTYDVDVGFGYAYVADSGSGVHIIDIDPLGGAYIEKTIPTSVHARGIYQWGEYAYVAEAFIDGAFEIIDVEPPGSASVVKTIPLDEPAYEVYVSGGYAYVANWEDGLVIIDVDPVGSAYVVTTLDTPGYTVGVFVTSYMAYVADRSGGLRIIRLW